MRIVYQTIGLCLIGHLYIHFNVEIFFFAGGKLFLDSVARAIVFMRTYIHVHVHVYAVPQGEIIISFVS